MSSNSAKVQTVLGPVAPRDLGHIQCHEHIWLRKGPSYRVNPALWMEDHGRSLAELLEYRAAGGGAILDAQPGGFGRDAGALVSLSRESKVHILGITGFHKRIFCEDQSLYELDEAALAERFAGEVLQGMLSPDGKPTGARAAMIKGAMEGDDFDRRLFGALARAARESGAPVMIHTDPRLSPLPLLDFLEERGVAPRRVLLCHCDRTQSPKTLPKLLDRGCFLCLDSINRPKHLSHEAELDLIVSLLRRGYTDRLLLSLDTTAARLRAYGAKDMGLDYILRDFRSRLARRGVTEEEWDRLTRLNALSLMIDESEEAIL